MQGYIGLDLEYTSDPCSCSLQCPVAKGCSLSEASQFFFFNDKGQQMLSTKGLIVNYSGFCWPSVCYHHSTLPLQCESSHRQRANEWM